MKKSYTIQFVCLVAVLAAILVQGLTRVVEMKPLDGYTKNKEAVELNFWTYYDGSFQEYFTEYAKQHTGFREFFIRNYNQMAYSLFGRITNDNVAEGLNHELFLKMYLMEASGDYLYKFYPDVDSAKADARKNVEETLMLIDTLQKHGTKFLFVFCPTKPAVYPEYLPKRYRNRISDFSLEEYYIDLFKEKGIPHIDFYHYFQDLKDDFPYPLYARTGTHWAESTVPLVADSIYRKLESLTGYSLPSIETLDLNVTDVYTEQEGELEGQMNLLFPLEKPKIPQPVLTLRDTVGKDRPKLLVVGDSYYVSLRRSCFGDAFGEWNFWKYNREIRSSNPAYDYRNVKYLPQAPLVIEDADIVMCVVTAPMLYEYLWGFNQSAMQLFAKGGVVEEDVVEALMQEMRDNDEWYQELVKQAEEKGITIEQSMRNNAIYVLENYPKTRQKYGLQ